MGNNLVITKLNGMIVSAIFEKNAMIQVQLEKEESEEILGNIYLGKVKNIIKNINAAFVEIENQKMCYLSLEENYHPIYNAPHKGDTIHVGDEFLVQVSKEGIKTKAPMVTTNLNLTGKYLVLVHGKPVVSISSKIESDVEKKKLKQMILPHISEVYGFIIRTNAAYADPKLILFELQVLLAVYNNLKEYGVFRRRFSKLMQAPKTYLCAIRDGMLRDIDCFTTDDQTIYDDIKEYLQTYQQEDSEKLRFYSDPLLPLVKLYGIETKLENALKEKIWLRCGGSLVIQPTEALTAIDVNTGKAVTGRKHVEETFLKVNLEAAKEIAMQIRLRNLSGIIIIDFIDMKEEQNKKILLSALKEYLSKDPIKTTLIDITPLNLVEVTRKKLRKPLYEQIKALN